MLQRRGRTEGLEHRRRIAAVADVEGEEAAKEAARLAHDRHRELGAPRAVAQAPPQECPIELVDGEVLEARVGADELEERSQHDSVPHAHELARLRALAAPHGVAAVESQRPSDLSPGGLSLRDEAPREHVALHFEIHSEQLLVDVADQPVERVHEDVVGLDAVVRLLGAVGPESALELALRDGLLLDGRLSRSRLDRRRQSVALLLNRIAHGRVLNRIVGVVGDDGGVILRALTLGR